MDSGPAHDVSPTCDTEGPTVVITEKAPALPGLNEVVLLTSLCVANISSLGVCFIAFLGLAPPAHGTGCTNPNGAWAVIDGSAQGHKC